MRLFPVIAMAVSTIYFTVFLMDLEGSAFDTGGLSVWFIMSPLFVVGILVLLFKFPKPIFGAAQRLLALFNKNK